MTAVCGKPAYLVLSNPVTNERLDLMDAANGYLIDSLDIAAPDVREDMNPAPDRSGMSDYTRLLGARAVTIGGSAIDGANGYSRQYWLSKLGDFADPSQRYTLYYQFDSLYDGTSRTGTRQLTVRPVGLGGPLVVGPFTAFTLQFKAPDPISYGWTPYLVTCAPSGTGTGRPYPWNPPRMYPTTAAPTTATVTNNGNLAVAPVFRIYGTASGIVITLQDTTSSPVPAPVNLRFQPSFTIGAGHYVIVDCKARTVTDDAGNDQYGNAVGTFDAWPLLAPGVTYQVTLAAAAGFANTSLVTTWQDGYTA